MTDYFLMSDNPSARTFTKGPYKGLVNARRIAIGLCTKHNGVLVVPTAPGSRIAGQVQRSPYDDFYWTARSGKEIVEYTLHKDGTLGRSWGPVIDNSIRRK